MAEPGKCPACGAQMEYVPFLNADLFGTGPDNPPDHWVCHNPECHGIWCNCCNTWHPFGNGCSVADLHSVRYGES